jgi:CDP-diacylglycerol--serine O-phosphatidyltransferase
MNEIPYHPETTGTAPRRRRLGRSIFILPSIFTVGNIFCGYYAILATMRGNFDLAAQAIGIAMGLDMLDGRIARMTNSTSDFGLQLDSLADVISFGLAPAILAYVWGLSTLNHQLGWISGFTFAICGAMRLARFNVQTGHFKHFVGLPIPAGGGTVAAIVYFFGGPLKHPVAAGFMVATVFMLAILMISTIRYSSLKQLEFGRKSHLTILVMAILLALIYSYPQSTLLAMAIAYVASGPLQRIYGLLRRRRPAAGELPLNDLLGHH